MLLLRDRSGYVIERTLVEMLLLRDGSGYVIERTLVDVVICVLLTLGKLFFSSTFKNLM